MIRAPRLVAESESNPTKIHDLYDEWADNYDRDLVLWGYDAPQVSASYLKRLADKDGLVLDVGCGTGLVGQAIQEQGFSRIHGIDFSEESLQLAKRRRLYGSLSRVDLTQLPTSLRAASFNAIVCTGVMAYLTETKQVCLEFCRIVKSGAPIILTQRSDLFDSRRVQEVFDEISSQGLWKQIEVTGSRPYLPGNPEFSDIGVRYCVFRKC